MSRNNQSTETDVRSELRALKEDLMTLRSDLGRTANAAVDESRNACNHLAERATEEFHNGVDAARQSVVQKPLTATAIAAGIGALIGVLIARR